MIEYYQVKGNTQLNGTKSFMFNSFRTHGPLGGLPVTDFQIAISQKLRLYIYKLVLPPFEKSIDFCTK